MQLRTALAATLVLVALPALAFAGVPTVIYSDIATSPTSDVPGVSGAKFSSFDRPYTSLSGNYWIFTADTDLPSGADEVIVVGQGVAGNTTVIEGSPAGWASGENVGFLDRNLGINDSGQYVFATNTDGDTNKDEYIVRWNGAAFEAAFREADPLPAPFQTEVYGSSLNSPGILNDGTAAVRAPSTSGALPFDQDDFLISGNTILAQEGVTIPTGQTGTNDPWDNFDSQDFYVSADGAHWFAQGDTMASSTSTDDIVAFDNAVKVQEDVALAGLASPVETIVESIMTPGARWFARGDNDDQQDWVVSNAGGTLDSVNLLAKTGDPVVGGLAGETFSDAIYSPTFFGMTANNVGDWIIAGTTSNADPDADAVIWLNGTTVLLRQGDAVDVDGNGLFDDDAFIDVFNNDDSFLTDDGWYYFTADLRDGLGNGIGQAYLRVLIPEPTSLGLLLIGAAALLRRR